MVTKSGWQIYQPLFLFCMDAYGLHKNARQSGYEVNDEEPGVPDICWV